MKQKPKRGLRNLSTQAVPAVRTIGCAEALEPRRLLSVTVVSESKSVPFERVVVDQNPGRVPLEKTLADIEGTGQLDIVVGHDNNNGGTGGIVWYQYPPSGNITDTWKKFTIAAPGGQAYEDMVPYDLEGNGVTDIIASYNSQVVWFENPRNTGGDPTSGPWKMHVIGPDTGHEIVLADLDGDGKIDVATRLHIYFQNSPTKWTTIDPSDYGANRLQVGVALFNSGSPLGAVDLAGTGAGPSPNIGWYENPRDHGGNARTDPWIFHSIGPNYATSGTPSVAYAAMDVNGDGRQDIITALGEVLGGQTNPPGGIIWWQAPANRKTGKWIPHTIDASIQFVHRLSIADMNNDGRPDIVFSEQEQSTQDRVGILYNVNGTGLTWNEEILSTESGHNQTVGDVNGDGNLDILNVPHGVYTGVNPVVLFVSQLPSKIAPKITLQPKSQTVNVGLPVTLRAVAVGAGPMQYQWQRNDKNIAGATTATYTLSQTASGDDQAQFDVIITNASGTAKSKTATLTLTGPMPPRGVKATAGESQVTLSWQAAAQADSYDVFRSTTPGGEGSTALATGITSTSYVDSSATNGTCYYYKIVVEYDNFGAGAPSAEVSATPQSGPEILPLSAVVLNQPDGTLNVTGSFTDVNPGPWTGTVNYGDGGAAQKLKLEIHKRFLLSHVYQTLLNRTYQVNITISDGPVSTQATMIVHTRDDPPHNLAFSSVTASKTSGQFKAKITFADAGAGAGDSFIVTTDFGDGTAEQVVTTTSRTVALSHTYAIAGSYVVTTTVKDRARQSATASMTAQVGGPVGTLRFLSDQAPTNAGDDPFDGSGFYFEDHSAATLAGGAHADLVLGSATYAKGLGVQPLPTMESDLKYSLGGKLKTFQATIGLDAATGKFSAADFSVLIDGVSIFDSGKVIRSTLPRLISLNVHGAQTLELVVVNDGTNANSDFADWAGARVIG